MRVYVSEDGQGLIGPGETHQGSTSASDGPANRVGGPVDSVVVKERGLFDGDGIFRWTLWSGHARGLGEGVWAIRSETVEGAPDPSELLPSDGGRASGLSFEGGRGGRVLDVPTTT